MRCFLNVASLLQSQMSIGNEFQEDGAKMAKALSCYTFSEVSQKLWPDAIANAINVSYRHLCEQELNPGRPRVSHALMNSKQ